eukprot:4078088-Pyramimonas_sp.AAC.1
MNTSAPTTSDYQIMIQKIQQEVDEHKRFINQHSLTKATGRAGDMAASFARCLKGAQAECVYYVAASLSCHVFHRRPPRLKAK